LDDCEQRHASEIEELKIQWEESIRKRINEKLGELSGKFEKES